MQLLTAILRGFQAIFAIIVLGISVDLARGQDKQFQAVPAATGYAAFCGAFGVLAALVGITSIFVTSLEGLVTWALDGLSAVTMLASGIAYAVLLRNATCGDWLSTWSNVLLSGGCGDILRTQVCRYATDESKLKSRCVSARADSAFMFISFVTCLGIVAYTFFMRGREKGGVNYA
ncbi:marvel domain-containing protein [Aspergillus varians]